MIYVSNGESLVQVSTDNSSSSVNRSKAIYGVTWDGQSRFLTRTDDASSFGSVSPYLSAGTGSSPFDSISPWSDMTICKLPKLGVMVYIPKFYYQLTQNIDNSGISLRISMTKHEGFEVSPAHCDRDDGVGERDYVLVSRYLLSAPNNSVLSTPLSAAWAGKLSNAHDLLQEVDPDLYVMDYWTLFTIQLLYLVELAEWSSQTAIGYGGNDSTTTRTPGTTNSVYCTGSSFSQRDYYTVGTQYRNIESLWDNTYSWISGAFAVRSGELYLSKLPSIDKVDGSFSQIAVIPNGRFPASLSVVKVGDYPKLFLPLGGHFSSYEVLDQYHLERNSNEAIISGNFNTKSLGMGIFSISNANASSSYGARAVYLFSN